MTDEHPTQPLPDPSAQWVLQTPDAEPAPARRRRWPWVVGLVVVVVLVVVAWFVGESIARSVVERTIREQISSNLNIPADHPIDVDIPGPILPQLIVGSLAEVTISSDDVPLEQLTADVTVRADDVPVRGGDWSGATAEVTIDEAQLQALLAGVDDFPASTVAIDAPDITATFELNAVVTTIPVGVALTPSAQDGDLVLTPASLRIAGAEISADAIVGQFGAIASTVVRDWDVCIAQYLPKALTLTGVGVETDAVTADFEISSDILTEPSARENGTCA